MAPAAVELPEADANKSVRKPVLAPSVANGSGSPLTTEHNDLLAGLRCSPKQIPCSFLYDAKGTALYNQIVELEEYYPYRTELEMLREHAEDIITHIPPGSVVVELGCGSAQKTAILQRALLARDGGEACSFVGIDVSGDFLEQAKANMLAACPGLLADKIELVQAAYLEGLKEARAMHPDDNLCILWLGSSVGNLSPSDTLAFFKDILEIGGPQTSVLVCTDLWKDKATLHAAYCDSKGVTEAFIKNGAANAIAAASVGRVRINARNWQYDVVVNDSARQVEMYVVAGENLSLDGGVEVCKGERILMEVSRKFTSEELRGLAYASGFFFQAQWRSEKYSMQLFCAPFSAFQLAWQNTDQLFAKVDDWGANPIDLRHPFCFYYGHVVSFAKLRLLKESEPSSWDIMFSRGIDPDVSNPQLCHSHPEAPKQWPAKAKILRCVQQSRQELAEALKAGGCPMHFICMALEHERMHQETLCYMLAQQNKAGWEGALPLQHTNSFQKSQGNGAVQSREVGQFGHTQKKSTTSAANSNSQGWVAVPSGKVAMGVATDGTVGFVWDNEGPPQGPIWVNGFTVAAKPVSIAEFRKFVLQDKGYETESFWNAEDFAVLRAAQQKAPSTWTLTEDGEIWVHYPEGTVHWEKVKERPVWCSLAEARAYCGANNCRVMSELEYLLAQQFDPSRQRIENLEKDGWEWTSTLFTPFKGFSPTVGYEEYSADFFDEKHFVLKGSSPYTHSSATRPSFRNFYQRVYPHMFAKFRCCD